MRLKLITVCTFLLLTSKSLAANQNEKAIKKAAEALYKQTGVERRVKEEVRKLKHEYVSGEIEVIGGWAFWARDALIKKKVYYTYKWEF